MKILAPLSNPKETKRLLDAGADELYFGMASAKVADETSCLNFRPVKFANFRNIKEARQAVRIVKDKGKAIFLCLNTNLFSRPEPIYSLLGQLEGLNGIIATDISLINSVHKIFPKLKIIASIKRGIFNSPAVSFFHSIGVSRITLPLRLSFQDTLNIIERNCGEFEIFVRNEGCLNISAFCNYTHNIWQDIGGEAEKISPPCKKKEHLAYERMDKNRTALDLEKRYLRLLQSGECGICFINFFGHQTKKRIVLKIAGRLFGLERKLKDVKFIRASREILMKNKLRPAVVRAIRKIHLEVYGRDCMRNCSYRY